MAKYYREKEQKTRALVAETKVADVKELNKEIAELTEERDFLESHVDYLRQQLDEALQEKEILQNRVDILEEQSSDECDFRSGANGRPYSNEFRLCCWELLGVNVAECNLNAVITSVLKLVGKQWVNKPSINTISDISAGRLSASQQQLEVDFESGTMSCTQS